MSDKQEYKKYVKNIETRIEAGEQIEPLTAEAWAEAGRPSGEEIINEQENGTETGTGNDADHREAYDKYVERIEKRIKEGETNLTVKPFDDWLKKMTVTLDGVETVRMIPGESGETKQELFKRVSELRLNRALNTIAMLENLSSARYESKPNQVKFIVDKLNAAVGKVDASLNKRATVTEKVKIPD